jgi:hypothetical protein
VAIRNTSGQPLDRVRVRFGGREVEARDLPAGVTATLPTPPGAEGDARADVWYADGRTAHTDLGGPGAGRKFGWRWVFVVAPPGPRGVALLEPTFPFAGRKVAWSPPAYANRQVFARNGKELICASLAVKP